MSAKLTLEDGSTLYASSNGRRELAHVNGPLVDAATLALTDLLGVVRDDKGRFVFVGASGEVFKSDEPLGPLSAPTPAVMASTKGTWWTTGRAAFVGVNPEDGRVFRSGDYGSTWQTVAYAGSTAYGKATAVELDPQGNGILLRFPQRVLVTHDDGLTWSPVPSPGIGSKRVLRDGKDRLYLQGRRNAKETPRARLDGSSLVVTKDDPTPLVPSSGAFEGKCGGGEPEANRRTLLSGDRIVELSEERTKERGGITVATGSIVTGVGGAGLRADLGDAPLSPHIASFGADVVYLGREAGTDAAHPTTAVLRSSDYGATWQKEATLEGTDAQSGGGVDVVAGPGGFTYVTALCGRSSPEGRVCAHRQIHPAGSSKFEDLEFDEEMTPISFAFDEKHDRVYALGLRSDTVHVYESPLSRNHFVRTKILDVPARRTMGLSVDDAGVVRALVYEGQKEAWSIHRRAYAGGETTTSWLAVSDGMLAFAGARGLIFSRAGHGWETADGGESWIPTATNGSVRSLACASAGCLAGSARRIGWDLPAVEDEKKVTAVDRPPVTAAPSVTSVTLTPVTELTCKPILPPTAIAQVPGNEMVDNHSKDTRWASVSRSSDAKTSIVFGTRAAVRETVLLPALPKGKARGTSRSAAQVLNDGVVAARYRTNDGEHDVSKSIDVELAWWSASTGRTSRNVLPKVPSFYLASEGNFSGTPQIVDGGLLFQAGGKTYFLRDDGHVESLSLPVGVGVRNAERLGKRWVFAESLNGTVQLAWSNDGGKLWSEKEWGLGANGYALVALLEGQPTLTFSEETSTSPSALFAIPAEVPDDPPPPVVIDSGAVDTPCDANAGALRLSNPMGSSLYRFRARIASPTDPGSTIALSGDDRVTHVSANGKICTSAITMSGFDTKSRAWNKAFLYPEANGWHGWWFRPDPKAKVGATEAFATPIACVASTPASR